MTIQYKGKIRWSFYCHKRACCSTKRRHNTSTSGYYGSLIPYSDPEKIGWTSILRISKSMVGKPILYKKCGILMHSSLAVTDTGLPLGLCAIKFWTRKQFKGTNELKKRINPTRISIEEKESYH